MNNLYLTLENGIDHAHQVIDKAPIKTAERYLACLQMVKRGSIVQIDTLIDAMQLFIG